MKIQIVPSCISILLALSCCQGSTNGTGQLRNNTKALRPSQNLTKEAYNLSMLKALIRLLEYSSSKSQKAPTTSGTAPRGSPNEPRPEKSGTDDDLVCGHEDGIRYLNAMVLHIGNRYKTSGTTSIDVLSKCPSANSDFCKRRCEKEFSPVCGTNGKTYHSLCDLEEDSCMNHGIINVLKEEPCNYECEPESTCEKDSYQPICGGETNDTKVTFANPCFYKVEACMKRWKNPDVDFSPCQWDFSHVKDLRPSPGKQPNLEEKVCGSDGSTYINAMVLHLSQKYFGNIAVFAHNGQCRQPTNEGRSCLQRHCPVKMRMDTCTSDGKTRDFCSSKTQMCLSGGVVNVVKYGRCKQGCSRICRSGLEWQPVCATTFGGHWQQHRNRTRTHVNYCDAMKTACLTGQNLLIEHVGVCDKDLKEGLNRLHNFFRMKPPDAEDRRKPLLFSSGGVEAGTIVASLEENSWHPSGKSENASECWSSCNKDCPTSVDVVCDQNGLEYVNSCFLQVMSCKTDGRVKMGYCKNAQRKCPTQPCGEDMICSSFGPIAPSVCLPEKACSSLNLA